MVMREGFLLVGAGVGMGLAGSLALTRTIRSLLFEVGPGTQPRWARFRCWRWVLTLKACYF